jgi:transcriptional regulator with XRE-family HTH domain
MLHTMTEFGEYIRLKREELLGREPGKYSLRRVAAEIQIEPSYLSKIERGQQPPPGERTIVALAQVLQEDPDLLLAMAGKVSEDLQKIIRKRPKLFAELIRQLKDMPDHAVLRLAREVRDGDW